MQSKLIVLWVGVVALVLISVPLFNVIVTPQGISAAQLFNKDNIQSRLSQQLFEAGISSSPEKVLVGKEGWLFLGNFHDHVVDKTRGRNEIITKHVVERANNILKNLAWIEAQGIHTVFAIVPNKHSLYPEYLPDWLNTGDDRYLNVVLRITNSARQNLLELKPTLLAEKSPDRLLYYPQDSHWNGRGAWIGYKAIMAGLNAQAGGSYQVVEAKFEAIGSMGSMGSIEGDLANLLKLPGGSLQQDSTDIRMLTEDSDLQFCNERLNPNFLRGSGPCTISKNTSTDVGLSPVYSKNPGATNSARVLWLRDSFGIGNSQLFQATFSELWQIHHGDLAGEQLREFILRENPHIVIYQVVERLMDASYLGRSLF